jgi:hypothetical protein
MDLDARSVAVMLARGRVAVGAVALLFPRLAVGTAPGAASGAGARSLGRMAGIRDLVLGAGAITCVREQTLDAEWVGMGGVVDLVDGATLLLTPRLPKRARLVGLVAFGAGVAGIAIARALADERSASPDTA